MTVIAEHGPTTQSYIYATGPRIFAPFSPPTSTIKSYTATVCDPRRRSVPLIYIIINAGKHRLLSPPSHSNLNLADQELSETALKVVPSPAFNLTSRQVVAAMFRSEKSTSASDLPSTSASDQPSAESSSTGLALADLSF